ncbi:hypothetical protein [Okeania sp. KiyG1]|nr:hypothetical protein [Okeania sp. KiyG1]
MKKEEGRRKKEERRRKKEERRRSNCMAIVFDTPLRVYKTQKILTTV